ncbi:MAG: AzlC family ABC transporter permease [Clostridia bacterium]|nr:AzlC family ABC transporter permease [Clostridia bacterium]
MKRGIRDGIPIFLGYLSVSFSFGIAAVGKALPVWSVILTSLTNVTSAGQLAGVSLIAIFAGVGELALTQLIINIRYALMSLSLSQHVDRSMTTGNRLICAFFMTDEIFALCRAQEKPVSNRYMMGVGLISVLGWGLGTTLGALAGGILPPSVCIALNPALYAMFIALVLPQAKKERAVLWVASISAGLHCVVRLAPVLRELSSGFALILCAVAAACVGAWLFPKKEA